MKKFATRALIASALLLMSAATTAEGSYIGRQRVVRDYAVELKKGSEVLESAVLHVATGGASATANHSISEDIVQSSMSVNGVLTSEKHVDYTTGSKITITSQEDPESDLVNIEWSYSYPRGMEILQAAFGIQAPTTVTVAGHSIVSIAAGKSNVETKKDYTLTVTRLERK